MKINWTQVKDAGTVLLMLVVIGVIIGGIYKLSHPHKPVPNKIVQITPGAKVAVVNTKHKFTKTGQEVTRTLEIIPPLITKEHVGTWLDRLPNGRVRLIDEIVEEVNRPVVVQEKTSFIPRVNKWGFGAFVGPHVKGWGLTHNALSIFSTGVYLGSGIIVGRDDSRALIGQWTIGLSKEVLPQLSLYLGGAYSVKYTWDGCIGLKYDW